MLKIIILLIFFIPYKIYAQTRRIVTVSSYTSDRELRTNEFGFSSEVLKNGFYSLFASKTFYINEVDRETELNALGLNYNHNFNRYFEIDLASSKATESEYLSNINNSLGFVFKLNPLWNSYFLTKFSVGGGKKQYNFYRVITILNKDYEVDITSEEKYIYWWFSHEFNRYFDVMYRFTNYTYDYQPQDYLERPLWRAGYYPELSSLLYSFARFSQLLSLTGYYKEYSLSLNHFVTRTHFEDVDERSNSLKFTYSYKILDVSFFRSRTYYADGESITNGLSLGFYF